MLETVSRTNAQNHVAMAQGQIPVKDKTPKKVFCSDCRHFRRDTEGPSYRRDTGDFFMGDCLKGLHPDTIKKQFADKPRICKLYSTK